MAKKKTQFSKEVLKVVPYADSKCPICKLPLEDIENIHRLRLEKKFKYKQLLEYIRISYKISPSYSVLTAHFKKHINSPQRLKIIKKSKTTPEVVDVLQEMPKEAKVATNKDTEAAYEYLTKMCYSFTKVVHDLVDDFNLDSSKLKEKLHSMDAVDSMQTLARLLKESRELIKDVTAIRAPKVLVAQFLESAVNDMIYSTGTVLNDMCVAIQDSLTQELKEKNLNVIDGETFAKIFKNVAIQYQKRMLEVKRDQMQRAHSALADMEKVI